MEQPKIVRRSYLPGRSGVVYFDDMKLPGEQYRVQRLTVLSESARYWVYGDLEDEEAAALALGLPCADGILDRARFMAARTEEGVLAASDDVRHWRLRLDAAGATGGTAGAVFEMEGLRSLLPLADDATWFPENSLDRWLERAARAKASRFDEANGPAARFGT